MSHDPKFDAPEFTAAERLLYEIFAAAETCDECAEPIYETDLAPSCGAHRLHLGCRGHFDCRWCDEEWAEANR